MRSTVIPTRGEYPDHVPSSPAACAAARTLFEMEWPVRSPNTRASGSASAGRIALMARSVPRDDRTATRIARILLSA